MDYPGQWILVDGKPEPCPDLLEWARWMETSPRVVTTTTVGDVQISTVFLGLDHRLGPGPPLLWETLVFGGPLNGEPDRYSSRAAAEAGHLDMVARVRGQH